jgi:hypothetical protein
LELVETVLVLLAWPGGEVSRGERRGAEGGAPGFLSGDGEKSPPLLDAILGFFSSEPLPVEDLFLLSELSFSLFCGFRGDPASFVL